MPTTQEPRDPAPRKRVPHSILRAMALGAGGLVLLASGCSEPSAASSPGGPVVVTPRPATAPAPTPQAATPNVAAPVEAPAVRPGCKLPALRPDPATAKPKDPQKAEPAEPVQEPERFDPCPPCGRG